MSLASNIFDLKNGESQLRHEDSILKPPPPLLKEQKSLKELILEQEKRHPKPKLSKNTKPVSPAKSKDNS